MNRFPPSALLASFSLSIALTSCGSGNTREITNLGSDTLLEVAGALSEKYRTIHPEIAVSVSGGGSGVGISQLIGGDVDIANTSRPLKDKEIQSAKKRGNEPVQHIVGHDGIAIYVHKDNPIKSISLAQLKAMFGDGGAIKSWKDIGIDLGSDEVNKVVLGSRQNNSGTYECFRNSVLGGKSGRFKQECLNLNGSKEVVEFCSKTIGAIGYSGLAYADEHVKVVPVSRDGLAPGIAPTIETVRDKSYAISRDLFMYTNGQPSGDIKDYLDWIMSDDGQKVLLEKGYVPMRKPKPGLPKPIK